MERCEVCMPLSLNYQINIEGVENKKHIPQIQKYLKKNDLLINNHKDVLTVKESAVVGLYDYISGHMKPESVSFRLDKGDWKPIKEALE